MIFQEKLNFMLVAGAALFGKVHGKRGIWSCGKAILVKMFYGNAVPDTGSGGGGGRGGTSRARWWNAE
ncbi:MAG: hypothetical protein CM15mV20_0020 [uncultured marine virus]|nr:MAG: hypothetical protein CM15mV20_0020 [uncultured marine virus]